MSAFVGITAGALISGLALVNGVPVAYAVGCGLIAYASWRAVSVILALFS